VITRNISDGRRSEIKGLSWTWISLFSGLSFCSGRYFA